MKRDNAIDEHKWKSAYKGGHGCPGSAQMRPLFMTFCVTVDSWRSGGVAAAIPCRNDFYMDIQVQLTGHWLLHCMACIGCQVPARSTVQNSFTLLTKRVHAVYVWCVRSPAVLLCAHWAALMMVLLFAGRMACNAFSHTWKMNAGQSSSSLSLFPFRAMNRCWRVAIQRNIFMSLPLDRVIMCGS